MQVVSEWMTHWVRVAGRSQIVLWLALCLLMGSGVLLALTQRSTAATDEPGMASEPVVVVPRQDVKEMEQPDETIEGTALTDSQRETLDAQGWGTRVAERLGVWVSVREQRFRLIERGRVVWEVPCSTAAKGVGFRLGSLQTPLGWHSVAEKIGSGKPIGQVYREKHATHEIWKPGDVVREDLVLTRVLTLRGEEPGRNRDGDVDSFARGIYVHGTNDEARIGLPTSHGCVRLTNADVVAAFDRIPQGTLVLITE